MMLYTKSAFSEALSQVQKLKYHILKHLIPSTESATNKTHVLIILIAAIVDPDDNSEHVCPEERTEPCGVKHSSC